MRADEEVVTEEPIQVPYTTEMPKVRRGRPPKSETVHKKPPEAAPKKRGRPPKKRGPGRPAAKSQRAAPGANTDLRDAIKGLREEVKQARQETKDAERREKALFKLIERRDQEVRKFSDRWIKKELDQIRKSTTARHRRKAA